MGTQREDGTAYESGDIFASSFEEMLAGEASRRIHQELTAGRAKCRACSYWDLCRGGCGFFKAMQAENLAAGYGDPIESYCALIIGLLSHVTTPAKREIILRAYRPLLDNPITDYHVARKV
jgi:radical SAM protein with 4Fe4S-binding SPASM domain